MAGRMRAVVLEAPGRFSVQERPEPIPADGFETVRVEAVGVCGTDLHIADGRHPRAQLPLVLGHEITGVVRGGDRDGRRVVVDPLHSCGHCAACRHGREHVCRSLRLTGIDHDGGLTGLIAVRSDRLHEVPTGIAAQVAVLAEPLAVAVHAVRSSRVGLGSAVVVLGAGPVGLLVALCARRAGARVWLSEPSASRRATAAALGLSVLDPDDPVGALASATGDDLADVVFDAAAHPSVTALYPALTTPGGQVVVVGVYPEPPAVDLQSVTFGELSLQGVRVYRPADIDTAVALIAGGLLDGSGLVTVVEPTAVQQSLADLAAGLHVKVAVDCTGLA